METVAIVGVGLIGGSFGLALRQAGFNGQIVGVSRPETISQAVERGAIDEGMSLEEAVPRSDFIYLSTPIRGIIDILPRLDSLLRPDALVTDAGSTKTLIVQTARESITQAQFLGGHPLAGKETRGVESASADLFEGRTYILTPLRTADIETPGAREFVSWLNNIGAKTAVMKPEDHDRTLAFTSHLPQLASTALAAMLNKTKGPISDVFGPGLLDSTRLALSPYEIWRDILDTNHGEVEKALDEYIATLKLVKDELEKGRLDHFFSNGAEFASKLRRR